MSIFIDGMTCRLCGNPMKGEQGIRQFSPFVVNEVDPFFIFHDGVFHEHCFLSHPLAKDVLQQYDLFEMSRRPQSRRSLISNSAISNPDDFLGLGLLTSNKQSPLFKFNYAHLAKSELAHWDRLNEFFDLLTMAVEKKEIAGRGIEWLLDLLRVAQQESNAAGHSRLDR